ncbi:MAG: SCP2 sterol-binding domain-containing protein [Deltaproteobacteria bacterium]|nr:SCP2 sterol-binding domain-containing protein [Deltaproteobacteria bacterium]
MGDFTAKSLIEGEIGGRVSRNPERAKKLGGIYEFVISGEGGGTWTVDLTAPLVKEGADPKMQVRIRMSNDDFVAVATKKEDAMKFFLAKKIAVEGNLMLAMKLRDLLDPSGW